MQLMRDWQRELAACNTLANLALQHHQNAGLTLPPYTTRLCTPSQRRPTPPGLRFTRALGVLRRPTHKNVGVRRVWPGHE